jgi:competence protein ComEC
MGGSHTAWRLAAIALAWLGGMALQLQQAELVSRETQAALLAAGLALLLPAMRVERIWWLACVAAALVAFSQTDWRAADRLADALPAALEGQDLQLVGIVDGLPQRSAIGLRFRFEVEQARQRDRELVVPRRLALGWYSGFREGAELDEAQRSLAAGQRWRFTVRLKRPHGHVNPHGFDYELALFEQGVRATGYVRSAERIDDDAGRPLERLRQRTRDAIEARIADPRAAGVLTALAIGDQAAIERDDWQLFRDTGVAHLMSISGLHVTMFAWLAAALIGRVWRVNARAMFMCPAPRAGAIGGLVAATAYAAFSGWGVPSQRTVWMLLTVGGLQLAGRRWPWPLVLLAAATVVTAFDPWALLQPGFWLSFAAVGLLMVSSSRDDETPITNGETRWRRWRSALAGHLRGGLRTQLLATFGLAPLTLVFFQQVSVVGFAANLIAIPLVTGFITPLALLGVTWAPCWDLAALATRWLAVVLEWMATGPWTVWHVAVAPSWAQLAGLLGAVLLIAPLPWSRRWLALPLLLPLLWPPRCLPEQGRFELLAADVGQGSAVLVRTRSHLLVYDSGPQYSPDSDAGQRVLMPLLRARGETRIDRLVLSHRDTDHVGGAAAMLHAMPVGELLSSIAPDHPLRAMAKVSRRCEAGQSWQWDGVDFEVLHPRADDYLRRLKPNAVSCVLRVRGANGTALLAGDIEREQEASLLRSEGDALRSDVVLVPHHGSRTSSTLPFVQAVSPQVAVVQAGYRNRFGHPVAEVVERWRSGGAAVVSTPACGAWTWAGEGRSECRRETDRCYWRHLGD